MGFTVEQSFDYFLDVFDNCGMHVLEWSDEKTEYIFFERFSINYPAALSEYTRTVLEDNVLIDRNISRLSLQLQTKLLVLNRTDLWNKKSLREEPAWREVLELSDYIKQLILEKWTEEELAILRGAKE